MFRDYIAEEIAIDCAEGLVPRREALRRLTVLGLSAAAATALISACATKAQTPVVLSPGPSPALGPPGSQHALPVESVTFPGQASKLRGAWSKAPDARGVVLVIHENRGLTEHIRTIPGRLAGAGYSALAIDLLSEEGGTETFADQAQATQALGAIKPERFVADLKSGLDELARREPGKKIAVMGFCFGGGLTWLLLRSKEQRLAAAVPFYGPLQEGSSESPVDFSGSRAAVLAFYASLDERVDASRGAAENALKAAGLAHQIVVEPDANHAFFNDTGPRYAPAAAQDAWQKTLAWFGQHLG